ncbi:hypothetical protein ACH4KN_16100 [Streptomyces sp. NPDC017546]|uniref:hypothetical protein n=1 Tax=Streptomyces sp. NPDC017546 TaxID=3365001 RepID=UPI00379E7ABB
MAIPPEPSGASEAPLSAASMTAIINRHTEEIAALKAPLTFSGLPQSIDPTENWKDLTSSHQKLYWSLQGVKVDVEVLALSLAGLSIAGTQVLRLSWFTDTVLSSLWQRILSSVERRRRLGPVVRALAPNSEIQQHAITRLTERTGRHETRIGGHTETLRTLGRTSETLRDTVGRARRLAESAVTKADRTSTAVGRQVGALRGDLGRARQVADRALVRADSAHRRIDGADTGRRNRRADVAAVGTSRTDGPDPRRLREAGEQIRQLEARVNGLVRALS